MYSLYITPPLPAGIVYDCREGRGVIYIGNTQSVIASRSCFCSFFTSHPYILSKYLQCKYLRAMDGAVLVVPSMAAVELSLAYELRTNT